LTGAVLEQQLAYWREHLAGAPEALQLPTDRPRPPLPSLRGASLAFELSREVSSALVAMSRKEATTPFMTLLAVWSVLLSRYSGQDDIVIGTPIANRTRSETEVLVGFFVNTLALRIDLSNRPTFRELLGRVKETALSAYAHRHAPFERVVDEL